MTPRLPAALLLTTVLVGGCTGTGIAAGSSPGSAPTAPAPSATPRPYATPSPSATPSASWPTTPGPQPTFDPTSTRIADVFAHSRASALAATSVRIRGHTTDGATQTSFEVAGRLDGSNYRVRVSSKDRGVSQVVVVDGRGYVTGDDRYLQRVAGARAAELKGKFTVVEPATLHASPFQVLPILLSVYDGPPDPKLAGITAAAEVEPTGELLLKSDDPFGGTLFVSKLPEVLPIGYALPSASALKLAFSDWDAVPLATLPAPELIVSR